MTAQRFLALWRLPFRCRLLLIIAVAGLNPMAAFGVEFVVNRVYEHGFLGGAAIETCRFGSERIAVFIKPAYRPGYVVTQEGDRRDEVAPSGGEWVTVQCPREGRPEALAVSQVGVLQTRDGISWQTVHRPGKGKIGAAAFLDETIILATDQNRLHVREGGRWNTLPLSVEGKPYQLHFSSRQNGTLWVDSQKDAFHHAYWSADGGKTWSPASLSVLQGQGKDPSRFGSSSIGFFDANRGVALGNYLMGRDTFHRLIVTDDGGKSWRPLAGDMDTLDMQIKKIVSLGDSRLLVAGNHALYLMKAGSEELTKLMVRNAVFEGVPLKERFEGYSASVQGADVLMLADDPVQHVLFGRVVGQ